MKVYIHEYADCALLLSELGQVLGVYSSIEEARDSYCADAPAEKEIFYSDNDIHLDTAA